MEPEMGAGEEPGAEAGAEAGAERSIMVEATSLAAPEDGGDSPRLEKSRQGADIKPNAEDEIVRRQRLRESTGLHRSRASLDKQLHRPPLWSRSFGNPHGQWSTADSLKILDRSKTNISNTELVHVEKLLREYIYSRIDPFEIGTTPKHHAQLAPEGRQYLRRILEKAADDDHGDRISIDAFQECLGSDPSESVLKCLTVSQSFKGRRRAEKRPEPLGFGADEGLTADVCTALFMKYGHDEKGKLPIDLFVRRLFSGDAHVLSLEGTQDGAFEKDHVPTSSSRSYTDFKYKWQGMIKKAPRFCKTGFFAPSDWEDYATNVCRRSGSFPEAYLKLEHVYGFNGLYNTSTNLFYAREGPSDTEGSLVYYAAAVGVVYVDYADTEKRHQKFFTRHNDDITAIAMHPGRKTVATGQQKSTGVGNNPSVFIWDAYTRKRPLLPGTSAGFEKTEPIKLEFTATDRGIACLAFSPENDNGSKILTVTRDDAHTVRVWDWRTGKCLCDEVGMRGVPPQVFGCLWNPFRSIEGHPSHFITFGRKHILFWNFDENADGSCNISFKPGVFGGAEIQDVLCACFLPQGLILTGGPNGSITVFRRVTDSDADVDFAHEKIHEKTLSRFEMVKLRQRRSLKTVAVQEILRAHGPASQLSPDEDDHSGQFGWNIKNGGCTVLKLSGSNRPSAAIEDAFTVFSGGGDGRIIQWSISVLGLNEMDAEFKKKPYDIQNKIEYALPVPLTPVCVFDSRKMDPSGPLRMFIGLDACVFGDDGLIRKICVGDTENDIWEIVQTRTAKTQPFKGGKLTHFSEGQSGQVHGIAPYPLTLSLNSQDSSTKPFATASEDGNVYIWDATTKRLIHKFEIRRGYNMGTAGDHGYHLPSGCRVDELLRPKACAFDSTGTRLAVSTCGVRQLTETIVIKVPEQLTSNTITVSFWRSRGGGVYDIEVTPAKATAANVQPEPEPEPEPEPSTESERTRFSFSMTLPRGAKPLQELAIDVPSNSDASGYGQYIQTSAKEADIGGVVLIYEFRDRYDFKSPKKIYERKISLEAIDILKFSPDDSMLAAGSHDNNIYVLAVPRAKVIKGASDAGTTMGPDAEVGEKEHDQHFDPIGICACHSSYITAIDWSIADGSDSCVLQSSSGAYEVLYYLPEPRQRERNRAPFTTIWDGTMWPVCAQVQHCQRDTKWHTWTCSLGFPVMGMWSGLMDGTDINACDRAPFVPSTQLALPPNSIGKLREQFANVHSDFTSDLNAAHRESKQNASPGIIQKDRLKMSMLKLKVSDEEVEELVEYIDSNQDGQISVGDVVTRIMQNYPSSFLVSARDDGQVYLHHYPSVIQHAPAHGFRGHSSHVANIKFTCDGERVISCGGLDRTTFQWKTHGIVRPSSRFFRQRDVRTQKIVRSADKWANTVRAATRFDSSRQHKSARHSKSKTRRASRHAGSKIMHSKDPHTMADLIHVQDAELQLKEQEIQKLRADIDALQRGKGRKDGILSLA